MGHIYRYVKIIFTPNRFTTSSRDGLLKISLCKNMYKEMRLSSGIYKEAVVYHMTRKK